MKNLTGLVLTAFLFCATVSFGGGIPKKFQNQLDSNGLQFKMPENFKSVKIHDNPDMGYSFAIKHKKKDLEIRYSVMSLKDLVASYEKSKTDTNIKAIAPNSKFAKTMLMVCTYNISDSVIADVSPFEEDAAEKEFGADWGGFAFVHPRKTFAPDYQYCLIVALHKDNIAEGYAMFLFNDLSQVKDEVYEDNFYNLTFKQ